MEKVSGILKQLIAERDRLNHAIAALQGIGSNGASRPKRKLSAAGRARIAAAQKKRWAKIHSKKR